MHKNSQKMHFWVPWQHFGRKHEVVIIFRLSVGLKFGKFLFWSCEAEILFREYFCVVILKLSTQNNRSMAI